MFSLDSVDRGEEDFELAADAVNGLKKRNVSVGGASALALARMVRGLNDMGVKMLV